MARVRGNSRSAYDLKIKKKKEEKDAIKHGSEKVISTSRQGKKQYKYWDSNKRRYVSKENLTAKKVKPKVITKSGLSKAELEKKQKDINFRRRQGEGSSRTDKGYQSDPPPKKDTKKDTSTESSTESSSNGSSSKTENKNNKPEFGSVNLKASEGKNKEKLKVKPKKMHAIEKRNRERFGDAHVDKLKKQYADFKARRKKKKKK